LADDTARPTRFHSGTINLLTAVFCVATAFGIRTLGQETSIGQPAAADWPLHNRDVRNTRYSPLNQIDASNVGRLAVSWSFQAPGGINISATTPLVVQGVMYFNSGSQLFALDAATGTQISTFHADRPFRGGGRGPVYGDGRIYAFGSSVLYAVDAKTGKLVGRRRVGTSG
jgi:outer membrane protein assembly factor BamB